MAEKESKNWGSLKGKKIRAMPMAFEAYIAKQSGSLNCKILFIRSFTRLTFIY